MGSACTVLVMVGPHGSGKTTLGRLVAQRLGWRYDCEIGAELRARELSLRAGSHASRHQPEFDRRVIELEMERDRCSRDCRIVETWHPGNLAYARLRSPEVAARYEPILKRHVAAPGVRAVVQPLAIAGNTALERLTQPGPSPAAITDFFLRVGRAAMEEATAWGLVVLPVLHTDGIGKVSAVDGILERLCRLTTPAGAFGRA
jgi:predicted ATPase